jgi:hypothetical protein
MDPEGVESIHGLVNKINDIVGDLTSFSHIFYMFAFLIIDFYIIV